MMPSCDHTGTPLHFHSSTTSGSASLTKVRSRLSILPRQSPSSLILASISLEGDLLFCGPLSFMPVLLLSPDALINGGHRHRADSIWSCGYATSYFGSYRLYERPRPGMTRRVPPKREL